MIWKLEVGTRACINADDAGLGHVISAAVHVRERDRHGGGVSGVAGLQGCFGILAASLLAVAGLDSVDQSISHFPFLFIGDMTGGIANYMTWGKS
ncbi:hypothetical protein K432DRAFT_412076 [Lepidopterella palustris CBS 459.81]|uniref:Uncharacterized protein n=1 Tax=Lepidopterella palustris CBS 459.81 TaxID=1314670 RepID=A0A8E2DW84_9PEZI|nr:hypothetical protein K432DRAFT_412076 [Lepidopterella palustris CBS 459.81]